MLQKILFISVLKPLAYLSRLDKSPANTIRPLSDCRLWY